MDKDKPAPSLKRGINFDEKIKKPPAMVNKLISKHK